jgi:hypothetical protein
MEMEKEAEEMTFDSDPGAKYRIGSEVHDLKTRVSVLEVTTTKHATDLGDLKSMIAELSSNLKHQAAIYSLEMTNMRALVQAEIAAQFAKHEKIEIAMQSKVLATLVFLLLSILGTLIYFVLEKVPMR